MVANTNSNIRRTTTALLAAVLATTSSVSAQGSILVPAGSGAVALENLHLLNQYVNAVNAMQTGTLVSPQVVYNNGPVYASSSSDQTSFNRRSRNAADAVYTPTTFTGNGGSVVVNAGMTPEEVQFALNAHSILHGTQAAHTSSSRRRRLRTADTTQYSHGPVLVNAGMTPEEAQFALHAHDMLQGIPAAQSTPSWDQTGASFNRRSRNTAADTLYHNANGNGAFIVNAGMTPEEAQFALHAYSMLQGIPATQSNPSWDQTGTSFNRRSRNTAPTTDFAHDGSGPFIVNAGMTSEEAQFALNAHALLGM